MVSVWQAFLLIRIERKFLHADVAISIPSLMLRVRTFRLFKERTRLIPPQTSTIYAGLSLQLNPAYALSGFFPRLGVSALTARLAYGCLLSSSQFGFILSGPNSYHYL